MELSLTVHLPRRRPQPAEVVVRWHGDQSAGALCRALAVHLGVPVFALTSRGRVVPASARVGHPPLLHGAAVTAVTTEGVALPEEVGAASTVLELAVVGGPDAGRSRVLVPPGLAVGRAVTGGLSLADDALSRRHAEVLVDATGVTVSDCASTNGVLVDGARIEGRVVVDSGATVVLGGTTLRVRRRPPPGLPAVPRGDGRMVVRPAAARADARGDVVVDAPAPPAEPHRPRIPWVAALVPVPIAAGLALLLGPQLLLFALLGPVLLLSGALGDRVGAGRARRTAARTHLVALAEAEARLAWCLREEAARLDRAHPDPHEVLRRAEHRLPGLWSRAGPTVRLGLGAPTTRVVWNEEGRRDRPPASHAPVVLDLAEGGGLVVVGPPQAVASSLAGVLGQLATGCCPSTLRIAVLSSDPAWRWASRLPHAVAPPTVREAEVDGVEEVPSGGEARAAAHHRVLVVPWPDPADAGVVAAARGSGWIVLSGAPPGSVVGAGAVLDVGDDPSVTTSAGRVPLVPDHVGPWWSDRVSRALAPLRSGDATDTATGLPPRTTLSELVDGADLDPEHVAARWTSARGRLAAPVGRTADGPHHVDLVRDGPHVLVGGTTGSGKSQFLRTLVAGLAVSCSPDEVAFVLVDFKGGSAFGACRDLPHVVGLVTDLDEHLVDRALTSLGAELRRRERLFAAVGAADLDAYRMTSSAPEPLPRLVVVVDELKALVDEVPRFLDGLVRLAALGRSLGVHLVLATQRPSGAVTPAVQANVNLRLAFRVRDRADSVDVVDDPAAWRIDPAFPGRGVARGGDGRLVAFQAAVVGDPAPPPRPFLSVSHPEAGPQAGEPGDMTGSAALDRVPGSAPTGTASADSQTDDAALRRLVDTVRRAADGSRRSRPRRPWLEPLPRVVDPVDPGNPGSDRHVRVGVVDEPDLQRVSPLVWTPGDGPWLFAGAPRSGRSTAARAVVLAATSSRHHHDLHVHLVDPTRALADLTQLPHVGTRVVGGDRRSLTALVDHLGHLVTRRRADEVDASVEPRPSPVPPRDDAPSRRADDGRPDVLVVVDGWEQLVEGSRDAWSDPAVEALVTVLRDGPAVGVTAVVTGGRSLLQPRWSGVAAQTVLLGRTDPLDAALTGLRPVDLPHDPPPGRGVRVHDRREVQIAAAEPTVTALLAARCSPADPDDPRGPWRSRPLPVRVDRPAPTTPATAGGPDRSPTAAARFAVGLAVGDRTPHPVDWAPDVDGRRLLVAGPARSGRSTTLLSLAQAALDVGRTVVLVRGPGAPRTLPADRPEDPSSTLGHGPGPGLTTVAADDVEAFVEVRRRHPDCVVLVDDADRLGDGPMAALLREVGELLERDDGLLVVATTASSLTTRFRGLDVEVARDRLALLLMPRTGDGEVAGVPRLPDTPRLPGRGVLVGVVQGPIEVQVYLPRGSGAVDLGADVRDTLGEEGRQGSRQGHREDAPAEERQPALDDGPADGEEQRAPDDRRGLGPGGVAEPGPGQHAQADAEQRDEDRRHDDAHRVAALTGGELVEVEDGEAEQGQRLHPGQHGGDAAGAA